LVEELEEPTTRKIQRYGWKPSLPDPRDLLADTSQLSVLAEVDPREEYMTPVYDQLDLGSCTANAVAAAIDADRIVSGQEPFYPSRLWIYALERLAEGASLRQDTGAFGRDGFRVSDKTGIVPETDWPYSDDFVDWSRDPRTSTQWAHRQRTQHPYKYVPRTLTSIKRVLSNKQTMAFGFTVFQSFESRQLARTGIMTHPDVTRERPLGGHEVLLVGYLEDHPQYGLVRNSWGTDWAMDGYFLMPWTVLLDPYLSGDFRTIYRPMA
jgi:C1A family cysteine protease